MTAAARSRPAPATVLRHYEHALRTGSVFDLRAADGGRFRVDVRPWLAGADEADLTLIRHCVGPTLDVGCGPGRLVAALHAHGIAALGVDVSPTAIALTCRRGAAALLLDVFDALPDEGEWATIVLLDGNIGIGGDPLALLRRARELLRPGGRVIVETARNGDADDRLRLRAPAADPSDEAMSWARVGARPLVGYAAAAGLRAVDGWQASGRVFAVLVTVS